jgi:hypothetical protein
MWYCLAMAQADRASEVLNDVDSHEMAMSLPTKDVVTRLVDILGLSLVAVIGGVAETRAVAQWTTGREPQRPQVLRFALQIALMIAESTDGTMARAWFQGSNPRLDDRSPALMLHSMPLEQIQGQIAAAARAFAARQIPAPPPPSKSDVSIARMRP